MSALSPLWMVAFNAGGLLLVQMQATASSHCISKAAVALLSRCCPCSTECASRDPILGGLGFCPQQSPLGTCTSAFLCWRTPPSPLLNVSLALPPPFPSPSRVGQRHVCGNAVSRRGHLVPTLVRGASAAGEGGVGGL